MCEKPLLSCFELDTIYETTPDRNVQQELRVAKIAIFDELPECCDILCNRFLFFSLVCLIK